MSGVDITYADVTDMARQLDQGREAMDEILLDLQGRVTSLVADGFQTDLASPMFDSNYASFSDGVLQAVGALEGMSEFLKAVAQAYPDLDSAIARAIGG